MRHSPPTLRNPIVSLNWNVASGGPHRITITANATSSPAVIAISSILKAWDLFYSCYRPSHVFLYASNPRDCNGGGTSNITIS